MSKPPLYVTRPQLPPLEEFVTELKSIWASRILTNSGPYHEKLEAALSAMLDVPYISLFNNGTVALQTALDALNLKGEIITTPYSFVATSHCILKSGCTPVFADVNASTLNLDPTAIEAAITPATTAILPVHCYGRPCDVDAIGSIAAKHNLAVVYDAAHAFGVSCHCGSVLNHGDLSILSFHATKVFNTFEGGAIVSRDAAMKSRIDKLRNFGFVDEVTVVDVGGNGKMSELNAALGLLQLKYYDQAVASRREIDAAYRERLSIIKGITCVGPAAQEGHNYSYFPVLVENDFAVSRDVLCQCFRDANIYARRYFYPLISAFPMYCELPSADPAHLSVAADAASKVLCLPIFPGMTGEQMDAVMGVIEGVS